MKIKTTLLIFVFLLAIPPLLAQNNTSVKNIFDRYGKQKGSILIQLSTDILSPKTQISFYKSLVTKEDEAIIASVLPALEDIAAKGTKLTEIRKNGQLENAAYSVPISKTGNEYEYILYSNSNGNITFVYMKGKFPPQELEKELKKLKELFIYINK